MSPEKFVSVSSGLSVTRNAAGKISLREQLRNSFKAAEFKFNLQAKSGQAEFDGGNSAGKSSRRENSRLLRVKRAGVEFFDADKIGGEIVLRHWRAGDRFQPIGLKSAVKLQDLFVNAKIPAARRRDLILAATAGGEIFWVEAFAHWRAIQIDAANQPEIGLALVKIGRVIRFTAGTRIIIFLNSFYYGSEDEDD